MYRVEGEFDEPHELAYTIGFSYEGSPAPTPAPPPSHGHSLRSASVFFKNFSKFLVLATIVGPSLDMSTHVHSRHGT